MGGSQTSIGARGKHARSAEAKRARARAAGRDVLARVDIRGIVFDMDDVLYDATLWRRWLLQLLARFGVKTDFRAFYRTWDSEFLADVHRGHREYGEALQAFLLSQGLSWAQIDEVEAASRVHCQELETGERSLPGVTKTVSQLAARGIALAVLTDSPHPASRVAEKLERLGLAGCFQSVLTSFDLERTRPDARCYEAALAALGLPAPEVLYVGHDSLDLSAAAAVGWRTAAFNHDSDARADVYLSRFDELLELTAE